MFFSACLLSELLSGRLIEWPLLSGGDGRRLEVNVDLESHDDDDEDNNNNWPLLRSRLLGQ